MKKEMLVRYLCAYVSVFINLFMVNIVSASDISYNYQITGEVRGVDGIANSLTVLRNCTRSNYDVSVDHETTLKKDEEAILFSDIKLGHKVTVRYKGINKANMAQTIIVNTKPILKSCVATEEEIGKECMDTLGEAASQFSLVDIIPLRSGEAREELILLMVPSYEYEADSDNTSLLALLRRPDACDIVLRTEGRDISAKPTKGDVYPNIYTYYSYNGDETNKATLGKDVTYFWNGTKYEEVAPKEKRKKKNKK